MPDYKWVKKELSYNGLSCQFIGRRRPACAKCVEACSKNALLEGEESIEMDAERCEDCGDCVAVCPTGALCWKITGRRPIGEFIEGRENRILVICEKTLWHETIEPDIASGDFSLPGEVAPVLVDNIGFYSELDFIEALHVSRHAIVVLARGDADEKRPFARAAELVGQMVRRLFEREMVYVFSDAGSFRSAIAKIAEAKECALLPAVARPAAGKATKREELRSVLEKWLEVAGAKVSRDKANTVPNTAFATIECEGEKCILCGACANQCKVKALRVVSTTEEERALVHSPISCLNCGVCVAVCSESALVSREGLLLDDSFLSERELARSEGLRCAQCGKLFTMARRAQRASSLIREKMGDDPIREELLGLCQDCRAKKALFTYTDWSDKQNRLQG